MVAEYGRDSIRPGRVVCLGYDLDTGNGTRMPYPWLYVVAVVGDIVSGVLFNNDRADTASPRFYGTTLEAVVTRNGSDGNVHSHPLTVLGWWPEVVSKYLAAPATFPDVTLPDVAPAPTPVLSGETIAREVIVARLEEASRIASDYADSNELCGEFERCMEAIGLQDLGLKSVRERERYYRVTFTREVSGECPECGHEREDTEPGEAWLYITARDDDHAYDLLVDTDGDYASYLTGWDQDTSDVEMERA